MTSRTCSTSSRSGPATSGADVESPADQALRVMEGLMAGAEVTAAEIAQARDALVRAGRDLRQPINLTTQVGGRPLCVCVQAWVTRVCRACLTR